MAVAAFLPPGLSGYSFQQRAENLIPILPLWAYSSAGWKDELRPQDYSSIRIPIGIKIFPKRPVLKAG
jgi:hypothetical protein